MLLAVVEQLPAIVVTDWQHVKVSLFFTPADDAHGCGGRTWWLCVVDQLYKSTRRYNRQWVARMVIIWLFITFIIYGANF